VVTEYLRGGELLTALQQRPDYNYTEGDACRIIKRVLEGISFIHSKDFMHRDIKVRWHRLHGCHAAAIAALAPAVPQGGPTDASAPARGRACPSRPCEPCPDCPPARLSARTSKI